MARENGFWVRTVRETRTLVQVFNANSGDAKYVEKDGKKVLEVQPTDKAVEIVENFRVLTPMEQHILEGKMPELWDDVKERDD